VVLGCVEIAECNEKVRGLAERLSTFQEGPLCIDLGGYVVSV